MAKLDISNKTVAQVVSEDYRSATVFKKYGIDFCCGGGAKVKDVCAKKSISVDTLDHEIEAATSGDRLSGATAAKSWPPSLLADYIEKIHHSYVREALPLLMEFGNKTAKVHGHAHPELIRISELTEAIADELMPHMMKEEQVLFPFIRSLENQAAGKEGPGQFGPMRVENPIHMMQMEHEAAGAIMKEIREIAGNFIPPDYACNTWRVQFKKLEEFEEDLFLHIHLENNILFPKAIEMQNAIAGK